MANSMHGKLIAASLLVFLCSVSAARTNYPDVREVPHSEKSEAIFLYYQHYKPESTANPFNGTPQEYKA